MRLFRYVILYISLYAILAYLQYIFIFIHKLSATISPSLIFFFFPVPSFPLSQPHLISVGLSCRHAAPLPPYASDDSH